MIVRISLKFRQRFRYFNSSLTKFERIVWRNFDDFFLWQNVVAKRFATRKTSKCRGLTKFSLWQNVLPQHFATKKIVKISSKISLLQFKFWRNPNEILTKEFVAKSCGKTFCHKAPDEKSDEILTKWKRKKQQRKSLYQNILQVVGNHGGVRSQSLSVFWCCPRYHSSTQQKQAQWNGLVFAVATGSCFGSRTSTCLCLLSELAGRPFLLSAASTLGLSKWAVFTTPVGWWLWGIILPFIYRGL